MFNYSMFYHFVSTKGALFEAKIDRDFSMIESWLPARMDSVLDIGCGMGGIDILIQRNRFVKRIYLIDGDGTGEKRNGFSHEMKPWNDVREAKQFIAGNVSNCTVYDKIPTRFLVDLVISLKSWGHHYPVCTYLPLVKRSLHPAGHVIMDIRKIHKEIGLRTMSDNDFRFLSCIYETEKSERMVFDRKIS